jgi:bifunctional DNA-binding transcriptional regulator/antitoxin component of YhaV-PrlF toxin-antitoxin module
MQTNSQLIHHNQTVIPEPVMKALDLREGDAVMFEIDLAGVHLRKAPPLDYKFADALRGTLSEWDSAEDEEAYANL